MASSTLDDGPSKREAVRTAAIGSVENGNARRHYGLSLAAVTATVIVGFLFRALFAQALGSIGMLFLVPVMAIAVYFGLRPALFTAFASVLAYNFFFLPPLYTFNISDPNNWLSLAALLFVAVIAANLAARVRTEADLAARRARVAEDLYKFTAKMVGIARLDDILWTASFQIASMLDANVVILLPDREGKQLDIRGFYPPDDQLNADDLTAAVRSWKEGDAVGHGADAAPQAQRLFLSMRTGLGPVGVIGLHRAKLLTTEERRLLDSLNDQTALAIERALLAERVDEARVLVEADKLRVAMLSSLSHDLKTPLASILGAATTLAANLDLYDVERTKEILTTVREEAERLDRFVGNLLDMSRLEAGVLGAKPEPVDIADILAAATVRLRTLLSGHRLSEKIALDLPFARVDPLLLEQALVNVLDNAAKYSPTNSRIWLKAAPDKDIIVLTIEDEGPGIPPVDLAHVFDKFHRIRKADRLAGTGLGLSVARGFVESFGGTLTAANRDGKAGAIFTFRLPVEPEAKG